MEDRIVSLLTELVAIRTDEFEEPAQQLLGERLEACGFEYELQTIEAGRPNLVAQRGAGGTFFCSHVDVHPPHGHPDPFTCVRQDNLLVGRGVVDAKGQLAALVTALETVPDAAALVAITCDEERGGRGSEELVLPPGPWHEDGGVVLEPTGFRICTAQSGHVDLTVEATATPGHSFGPEAAGSPILAVLAAVDALETCAFLGSRHALLPEPRIHIGRIEGGEHLWRRPARGRADIALGVVPGVELVDAVEAVHARLDDLADRWAKRGTSLTYEITDSSDPIEIDPSSLPIARRLAAAMDTALEPSGMPSWTDAANLYQSHGLPCVVFGAGDLGSAHSDHEWVDVADLVRLAEVLVRLLRD